MPTTQKQPNAAPSVSAAPLERRRLARALEASFSAQSIRRRSRQGRFFRHEWWLGHAAGAALKRGVDLVSVFAALIVLFPLLLATYLVVKARGGGVLRTERLGKAGKVFGEFSFRLDRGTAKSVPDHNWLRKLPALLNVLRGEMSFVGPRPFSRAEVSVADQWAWKRFDVRPGLLCLWWIRRRANIGYRSEADNDAEYVDGQSMRGDAGILLRSIPVAFHASNAAPPAGRIDLLGIPIDNITMQEAVDRIARYGRGDTPAQICFVNADCVNIAHGDSEYKALLQRASLVLADGIGVKLAGSILRRPIRQNVNGTDLLPRLCEQLRDKQKQGVYLLGGKPGVAEDLAGWIRRFYPGVVVSGARHGYFTVLDLPEILAAIRHSEATVLLVALGAPRQDKWIRDFLPQTGCGVALGVGGLFDFYAGRTKRAPVWMREIGMEWFFRFLQEPGRMWRRYFVGNALFIGRVLLNRWTSPKKL